MTRPKALILAALLAAMPAAAPAAQQGSAPPVAGAATLAEGQLLRGRFEQERFLKGFQAPLKSGGSFLLAPGLGLIWRTETPFAVVTVMGPGGFVQEAQGQETMRMPAARLPFMAKLYGMMSGALTGDWAALSDIFSVTREDGGPGQPWRLRLEPRKPGDPNMPVRSITVSGTRFVEALEVVKPEGDRDRITLLDQRLSTAAPADDEARLLARPGMP